MTIQFSVQQAIERRGIITAYINFFDDTDPNRILKKSCFQAKSIEEIYVKIEEKECELTGSCGVETVSQKLDKFCKTRIRNKG
jgi:hypothetical protein